MTEIFLKCLIIKGLKIILTKMNREDLSKYKPFSFMLRLL